MCDCKKLGSTWACKLDAMPCDNSEDLEAILETKLTCRKDDEEAFADFQADQERDEEIERRHYG
jgi:hypothetical protein